MKTRGGEWILATIVGGSMLAVLLAAAVSVEGWRRPSDEHLEAIAELDVSPDTTALGAALLGLRVDKLSEEDGQLSRGMSGYFLHFEVASVHLLVVLIGAAYLARARQYADSDVLPAAGAPAESRNRRRGIFISLILFLAIVFHVLNGAFALGIAAVGLPAMAQDQVNLEGWLWPVIGVMHFAMAFAYIAILRWQKWGFYGLCVVAVLQAVLASAGGATALQAGFVFGSGALWLVILYGLLSIGGERSVWSQME